MLCLSGFELYSRWVPLSLPLFTQDYSIFQKRYSHNASLFETFYQLMALLNT